jgi:hypothetical protein
MISSCPSKIKSFLRPFASMIERVETRCCSAITLKVSPGRTRYLTNASVGLGAEVAVDVARGGGLVVVARGVEDGTLDVGKSRGASAVGLGGVRVRVRITEGTGDGDGVPIRKTKTTPIVASTKTTTPEKTHTILGNPSPSPK